MTPGLIQRHQDYVLGPNQDSRLASVAAGASFTCELHLDSDAPFALRSRAMRVKYTAATSNKGPTQDFLNHLLLRWAGPDRNYQSKAFIRQSLLAPYFGQIGNPIPVSPQVVYPRQGVIAVDIQNDGTSALTNLQLYFRGVKLFAPGAVRSYDYPATMKGMPFIYPQGQFSATDGLTLVRNVAVTQGPLRQTFKCKGDADFVLRAIQAGNPFPGFDDREGATLPFNEVFITLRDEDEKPYSNDPVHIDLVFGNSAMWSAFPNFFGFAAPIGGGPNSPGLIYPEIYIPKNHLFYFDVTRQDASYTGAVVTDLPVNFIGQKVFQV